MRGGDQGDVGYLPATCRPYVGENSSSLAAAEENREGRQV
jgi:hypothetical protein